LFNLVAGLEELMKQQCGTAICSILPPHVLRKLADKPELRDRVLRNLAITEQRTWDSICAFL